MHCIGVDLVQHIQITGTGLSPTDIQSSSVIQQHYSPSSKCIIFTHIMSLQWLNTKLAVNGVAELFKRSFVSS